MRTVVAIFTTIVGTFVSACTLAHDTGTTQTRVSMSPASLCEGATVVGGPSSDVSPLVVDPGTSLVIDVALARGVHAPSHGRVVLVARPATVGVVENDLQNTFVVPTELIELASVDLPPTLPARIELALPRLSESTLTRLHDADLRAGNEISPSFPPQVFAIVYDDANQDGIMNIGTEYPQPTRGVDWFLGGDGERAIFTGHDQWLDRVAHLNFLTFSNPEDPRNEVIAMANLNVAYDVVSGAIELSQTHTACVGDGVSTCMVCTQTDAPLPAPVVSVDVEFAL